MRGDVMIRCLWDHQFKSINDVKLGDADADSYKYEPMSEFLAQWEMIKNDKHGNHCHDQRKNFSPFVLSVDRMLGGGALVLLSQLSQFMAAKRVKPLLQVWGWVNGQITIVVARL